MMDLPEHGDSLSGRELSHALGLHYGTLTRWRDEGIGPKWYRVGPKLVRYRKADIQEWFHAQADTPKEAANR